MARGRFLNKTISYSQKFADLPDDTCRLIATWLIPHLDKNGVFYADAALVKGMVFPLINTITTEYVQAALDAMERIGLMRVFESGGRMYQCWTGFMDNQPGLRADRESTDMPEPGQFRDIPARTYDNRSSAALNSNKRGENPVKLSEVKLSEVKVREGEVKASAAKIREPDNVTASAKTEPPLNPVSQTRDPLYDAIAQACNLDPALCGNEILSATEKLRAYGAAPEQVPKFMEWWEVEDFRGQRGDPPTAKQLLQRWKDGMAGRKHREVIAHDFQAHERKPPADVDAIFEQLVKEGWK